MAGRSIYVGLILLVGLVGYAGIGGLSIEVQSSLSASPMNMGLYGTSELVHLASRSGYKAAILGSIRDLPSARASRLVYVLVAPDKPLSPSEVDVLARLVHEGRISLLVADEWGVANSLTSRVAGIRVNGSQLREEGAARMGLEDFVAGGCLVGAEAYPIVYSKPSVIEGYPPGSTPMLTASGDLWLDTDADGLADPGEPHMRSAVLGVALSMGDSRIAVLSDSSILVNYMLQGVGGLPATQGCVEAMLDWLAAGDKDTLFLFDNSHYKVSRYDPTVLLRSLLLAPQIAVQSVMSIASSSGQTRYMLFAAMLVVPLAGLVMRPDLEAWRHGGEGRWRQRLARRLAMELKARGSPCLDEPPRSVVDRALRSLGAAERLAGHLLRCLGRQREP